MTNADEYREGLTDLGPALLAARLQEAPNSRSRGALRMWKTPGYRKRSTEAQKEALNTPGVRASKSARAQNQMQDPEQRAVRSAATKARWDRPGEHERMAELASKRQKERMADPARRQRLREAALAQFADPVKRAKAKCKRWHEPDCECWKN